MQIEYSENALSQLAKIKNENKNNLKMILNKIEIFAQNPDYRTNVKSLKGKYGDFYRLRAGVFRIIFQVENNKLQVIEVKQRKDSYK
jgi:addiction module RelE/StbE family toxin